MHFLLIDTCTEQGLIAYGNQHNLLFKKYLPIGLNQSKFLIPALDEALRPFGYSPPLQAIGVGIGPGSYTGIRLGVAVAQSLAYCWKVPLIGVCSLNGFVPRKSSLSFAAILDARIGGVYVQKGKGFEKEIDDQGPPLVLPLEEVGQYLEGVIHLVTPTAKLLQAKLKLHYPDQEWIWEERAPSSQILLGKIEQNYKQNKGVFPPDHLDLLYLRETEAEREVKNRLRKEKKT